MRALVTGAGRGIGHSIADHLLNRGYEVLLHANASIDELKAWTQAHPRNASIIDIIEADLSDAFGQQLVIEKAKAKSEFLDLLVNNASAYCPDPFGQVCRISYQKMLGANLDAPFFITQGLLGLLRQAKNPSVINIVDAMWERPWPQFSPYAISKGGLAIMTRALAKELAPKIRVNGIAPGAMSINPFAQSEKAQKRVLSRIPAGKIGSGADVALAVEFLAEKATYITGEIISVDGGRSIS